MYVKATLLEFSKGSGYSAPEKTRYCQDSPAKDLKVS